MFRRRTSEANTEAAVPDRVRPAGQADPGGVGGSGGSGVVGGARVAGGSGGVGGPVGAVGGPVGRGEAGPGPRDSAQPWGPPPAGLDVSMPHPARVWNYWLGGRDFFAADKAAGEEIGREFPHLAQTARAERAF